MSQAKKEGSTLTGFEGQTAKYSEGLPDALPAPKRLLPFGYQSTGIETRFTNLLEPDAASRNVFFFHRPETIAKPNNKTLASRDTRFLEWHVNRCLHISALPFY